MSRVAKVRFHIDLLQNWLPAGSKILSVSQNDYGHTIDVLVEHSSFDEVPDEELPPIKSLMVHTKSHVEKVEYHG